MEGSLKIWGVIWSYLCLKKCSGFCHKPSSPRLGTMKHENQEDTLSPLLRTLLSTEDFNVIRPGLPGGPSCMERVFAVGSRRRTGGNSRMTGSREGFHQKVGHKCPGGLQLAGFWCGEDPVSF